MMKYNIVKEPFNSWSTIFVYCSGIT